MKDLMKLDLYDLLNIKANAAESEIKKAYRRKALICHPDKNPDNPKAVEDFKQLSKAVEILTDKVKRADYDRILRARKAGRSKIIYVRLSQVIPAAFFAARKREQLRKFKEDIKKGTYRQDPKKRYPTCAPSSSKAQDSNEDGPKQNANSKGDSPAGKDEKKSAPTWPPAFSKAQATNESSFRQNTRKDCPQKNRTKRSVPTWPPSTSETQPKKEDGVRQNINFKWNFSSVLKPATFIASTTSGGFSNNAFLSNQNRTGWSFGSSPIINPGKDCPQKNTINRSVPTWPPSTSKTQPKEEGGVRQNTTTFVAPSKS